MSIDLGVSPLAVTQNGEAPDGSIDFEERERSVRVAPESPIDLSSRKSFLRFEFDLREPLNADAPSAPIELYSRLSVLRVEFDLRESPNALAPASPIELESR